MNIRPLPEDSPGPPAGPARRPRRLLAWAAPAAACLAGASALTLAALGPASASTRTTAENPPIYVTSDGGNGQTTTTRSPFEQPLRVLVDDANSGHPVAGTTVTFRIVNGGNFTGTATFPGGAQSADAVTGADGTAVSPVLTAGADVGLLDVVASVPGGSSTATFVLRVGYSPAARIDLVSGDAQSAPSGADFAHPYVVRVLDAHGYPVQDDEKVDFTVQPVGPHPGTATFPGGHSWVTMDLGADGYATSPTLTGGNTPGTFTVIASVPQSPNAPEAVFTGTTLPQAPTTIEVQGGNYQFVSEDKVFPTPLQVRVLDQAGHPVYDPDANVTVTGPAWLYGRTSLTVAGGPDGVISMPLAATDGTGPVTLTLTAGTAKVSFHEYVVPGRGAVTITALRGGDQQTNPGQPFPSQLGVLVQDGDSMDIPNFPVTFAVDGPAAFADGSQTAVVTSAVSNVTTAPALHATGASGPVTVTVTIAGNDASAVFHLKVGDVNRLIILGGDRQTAPESTYPVYLTPFPAPLTVEAIQSNDRPANGVEVTYTAHGPAVFDVNSNQVETIKALTGTDGKVSVTLFSRYNVTGAVTVTATAPEFGSVTFTETVVPR